MLKADALLSSPGATKNGHFTPGAFSSDQEMSPFQQENERTKVKLCV